jgi:hypothetical protein
MDLLVDLIKVYDNALDSSICEYLVDLFDNQQDIHERLENNRKPNFTQINFTEISKNSLDIKDAHNIVLKSVLNYKEDYYSFIDKRCFPESNAFEQLRIKKYNTDGNDAFDPHVDVTDHESSRRFLSFLFYLNDVSEGGETVFKDKTIKPQSGRLVVFPPMWMYPHCGKEPVSNPKYILSTYLHYK